jgi:hypothetical protein
MHVQSASKPASVWAGEGDLKEKVGARRIDSGSNQFYKPTGVSLSFAVGALQYSLLQWLLFLV